MSPARVYRGGTPADPGTRGGSPRDRQPACAAGATGGAGSAGGCGAHFTVNVGAEDVQSNQLQTAVRLAYTIDRSNQHESIYNHSP
jgi:hypothetical protein